MECLTLRLHLMLPSPDKYIIPYIYIISIIPKFNDRNIIVAPNSVDYSCISRIVINVIPMPTTLELNTVLSGLYSPPGGLQGQLWSQK